MQRAITDFAADQPFAVARMKLLEHYGFEIGESTIQRITLSHAQAIFGSDRAGLDFPQAPASGSSPIGAKLSMGPGWFVVFDVLVVQRVVDIFGRGVRRSAARVAGGQMMAFSASARRHVRRQSAGAGSGEGAARGVSGFAGGKSGRFGRCVFDQEREEEMRGDPGSGEPRVLSGQPVEAQDGLQSFEG